MTSTNGIGNAFATFNGTDWVTYNSTTGAVGQLNSYTTLASAGATGNVTFTGNATLSTTKTINSLRFISQTGGQSLNLGANNLTIASGGLMRSSGEHNFSINGTGTLRTTSGVELVIHNNSSNQITINTPVSVSGVTINSPNRVIFANNSTDFGAGSINVVKGYARFTNAATFNNNINVSASNAGFELNNNGTSTFNGDVQMNGELSATGTGNNPTADFGVSSTLRGYGASLVNTIVRGTLNPGDGDSSGTLAFNRSLTLDSTSTTQITLGGQSPGDAGAFYDQINKTSTTGSVTITTGAQLAINLADGYIPLPEDIYYILTRADAGSTYGSIFDGLLEGSTLTVDGYLADITYAANWTGTQAGSFLTGGNDVAIYNIRAIPEPSAAILVGGFLGISMLRRRRI